MLLTPKKTVPWKNLTKQTLDRTRHSSQDKAWSVATAERAEVRPEATLA